MVIMLFYWRLLKVLEVFELVIGGRKSEEVNNVCFLYL